MKSDLRIELRPARHVRVRYFGPPRYASLRVAQGATIVVADGLESGISQVCVAPAGALRLVLSDPNGRQEVREIELAVGATMEVVFDWR
jgi:hypothetical protein